MDVKEEDHSMGINMILTSGILNEGIHQQPWRGDQEGWPLVSVPTEATG